MGAVFGRRTSKKTTDKISKHAFKSLYKKENRVKKLNHKKTTNLWKIASQSHHEIHLKLHNLERFRYVCICYPPKNIPIP